MISIRVNKRDKWHYLFEGRPLCGAPGEERDRADVPLAEEPDRACLNCDMRLRLRGAAKEPPPEPVPEFVRLTTYEPTHRMRFIL